MRRARAVETASQRLLRVRLMVTGLAAAYTANKFNCEALLAATLREIDHAQHELLRILDASLDSVPDTYRSLGRRPRQRRDAQ